MNFLWYLQAAASSTDKLGALVDELNELQNSPLKYESPKSLHTITFVPYFTKSQTQTINFLDNEIISLSLHKHIEIFTSHHSYAKIEL